MTTEKAYRPLMVSSDLHRRIKEECFHRDIPISRFVTFWMLKALGDLPAGSVLEDWYAEAKR